MIKATEAAGRGRGKERCVCCFGHAGALPVLPGWVLCVLALRHWALSTARCCPVACLLSCRGRIHAARSLATDLSAFVVSTVLLLRDQASTAS